MTQQSRFIKEKERYFKQYRLWKEVYCPALETQILFTRKGWDHLVSKPGRTKGEKLNRIRILPLARKLLSITTTIQEKRFQHGYLHYAFIAILDGRRIKVVIYESKGRYYFWTTFTYENLHASV